ncbi:NADH-quinone oxidoreductase subunit NuoK [Carboxydochorda subterranea]|uniref:NADH-quinone oxidoreductase subunit K n=1 Tax=Carboxydichorda subterranea TaxID=3109565 RepID=A0ABZ1BZN3_9FIRM|nr:NADH-quinone oxidoreductase subunit NuoK [Limnochorda sp. L945t]WRP18199.1 NADH-quinone oxidoreductase subunit NuoK [Limnochorda sp. L945t]
MPGAPVEAYMAVAVVLFGIGGLGVLVRRSPLAMLMSVEVMWNAAGLAFLAYARHLGEPSGQVMAFLAMTVAAAEAAIGLALIVTIFRARRHVDADDVRQLNG